MRGIVATGCYLPKRRIGLEEITDVWDEAPDGSISKKAVPGPDEDSLTMAVMAARQALDRAGFSRDEIRFVGFASTTPPLEEESVLPQIVAMLGLNADVRPQSCTEGPLAWAQLLSAALDGDGPSLVAIGDCPAGDIASTDHWLGAGGVAFVIDENPQIPVLDSSTDMCVASGIRYRPRSTEEIKSLDITTYERQTIRSRVIAAVDDLTGVDDDVAGAALPQFDARIPFRVARDLPITTEAVSRGTIVDRIGDAGAATVPLGLLRALGSAQAGATTIAADFGSGGTAMAFRFEGGIESSIEGELDGGEILRYRDYLRLRGTGINGDVAGGGVHISVPAWQRTLEERYQLLAGSCSKCEALSFPAEGACPSCNQRVEYSSVAVPHEGEIRAVTTINRGGAPPEFATQQLSGGPFAVALIDVSCENGWIRVPAQITDSNPDSLAIGDQVVGVIRRLYTQEGIPRYGMKFRPA